MEIKHAVISGAASFTGVALTEDLLEKGIEVTALVRPGSTHNVRLSAMQGKLHVIEAVPEGYDQLGIEPDSDNLVFFHLLWGGKKGIIGQIGNLDHSISAVNLAARLGCRRFIAAGSQAEYGLVPMEELVDEERVPKPINAYGAMKVAACYLTKQRASELSLEWIWARIFSLIGRIEPRGRMLPDLYYALRDGQDFHMSSGHQNWDYLDVHDAADALITLAERGSSGEIYNVAHGEYRPLREYTEELKRIVGGNGTIVYGDDPDPFISLQPSVEKIRRDTGWTPKRSFAESIADYALGE